MSDWILEHVLAFEERDDVCEHLNTDHATPAVLRALSRGLYQRGLNVLHVAEHKRLANFR